MGIFQAVYEPLNRETLHMILTLKNLTETILSSEVGIPEIKVLGK